MQILTKALDVNVRYRQFHGKLMLAGIVLIVGCRGEPSASSPGTKSESADTKAAAAADPGPSVVELRKADAFIDKERIARLEIHYSFSSGSPTKHYLCKIRFPNVDRTIAKFMAASELSQAGAFKTAIEAGEIPPDSYEIVLSEAESPDAGFYPVSNTLSGAFQKASSAESKAP